MGRLQPVDVVVRSGRRDRGAQVRKPRGADPGEMQISDLAASLMLMAFLYDPIGRLHQLNQLVQAGSAAGERVFEILDESIEPGWTDNVVAGVSDPALPSTSPAIFVMSM